MEHKTFRSDFLKKEIELVTTKINHFDNLRLKTKQMAIVLWTATVGFGLKENINLLYMLSVLLPIPFWLMETSYRRYSRGFHQRLRAVRDFLRDGEFKVKGEKIATLTQFLSDSESSDFPLFDYWGNSTIAYDVFNKQTSFYRSFFNRNLLLIYGSMIVISICLSLVTFKIINL